MVEMSCTHTRVRRHGNGAYTADRDSQVRAGYMLLGAASTICRSKFQRMVIDLGLA